MRAIYFILTISFLFSSCVLLSQQKEVQLNLPENSLLYRPGMYRIYSLNAVNRGEHEQVVYLEKGLDFFIEKEGLTFVVLTPLAEPQVFKPFALGAVIDPQQNDVVLLTGAGAVSSELYIRLRDSGIPFNYLRFQLQTQEKLGDRAWRMDLDDIVGRIVDENFSSRYIQVKGEILFPVVFPPGLWVSEDPSLGSRLSDGVLPWELPLHPQSGLRFINRDNKKVLEFYCTAEGRLLQMERSYSLQEGSF